MSEAKLLPHSPRWYWIPARVILVTLVVGLLAFAVSLLLGILGVVIGAKARGVHPDLPIAYRHIAAPAAAVVAGIVFVSALVMEIRHYRQQKALAQIARSSS